MDGDDLINMIYIDEYLDDFKKILGVFQKSIDKLSDRFSIVETRLAELENENLTKDDLKEVIKPLNDSLKSMNNSINDLSKKISSTSQVKTSENIGKETDNSKDNKVETSKPYPKSMDKGKYSGKK